jgi:uncharacterized protein
LTAARAGGRFALQAREVAMKKILCTLLLVVVSASATEPKYDAALASRLKADDIGMRMYVMALLKAGPSRNRPPEEARALQAAHMANIDRLAAAGKLVLAGPFGDNGELRGIYIFDVATVAEAEALTRTDPAVKAGQLVMELHPWYGSAALMLVNEVHANIKKPAAVK